MDTDKIYEIFEDELKSWAATRVLTFENVKMKNIPPKDEAWARFSIAWFPSENIALGTKTMKSGIATLQVFVPKNVGPRVSAKIADAYFNLLENRVLSNSIFTYAGSTVKLDGGQDWHQLNADLTFQAT